MRISTLRNTPTIGLTVYYQDLFIRERTDGIELEKTKPVESWGASVLSAIGFVVFLGAVIYFI